MIKTLAKCIGKYKKESIITPIFTAVEVFLEILIPFITASIIDKGIQAGDMRKVGIYGGIMLIIAFRRKRLSFLRNVSSRMESRSTPIWGMKWLILRAQRTSWQD